MTTNFKFFYDGNLFPTLEIAKANFQRSIAKDEKLQRALKAGKKETVEELYPLGGAQYIDGRWEIFDQINIYQNLDNSKSTGADNVIVECPKCGKSAVFRSGAVLDRYVHVDGSYKIRRSDILYCDSRHEVGGLRDYSS
jgi:hypothetical protein